MHFNNVDPPCSCHMQSSVPVASSVDKCTKTSTLTRRARSPYSCKQHLLWKCVNIADMLLVFAFYAVFFPAIWLCLRAYGRKRQLHEKCWWLLVVLLQPAALLIDHGHFQYNNISQGFTVCPCSGEHSSPLVDATQSQLAA